MGVTRQAGIGLTAVGIFVLFTSGVADSGVADMGIGSPTAIGAAVTPTEGEPAGKPTATPPFISPASPEIATPGVVERAAGSPYSANIAWMLVAGFVVMLMQAGFGLLEAGLCRAKNATHTMSMSLMVFPLGCIAFWAYGFALGWGNLVHAAGPAGWSAALGPARPPWIAVGASAARGRGGKTERGVRLRPPGPERLLGTRPQQPRPGSPLLPDDDVLLHDGRRRRGLDARAAGVGRTSAFTACGSLCLSASTPTGCGAAAGSPDAGRTGTWARSGRSGRLRRNPRPGRHGGTGRHPGPGPRLGKYREGRPMPIPGHHVPMVVVGTLILAFGWFGMTGGCGLAGTDLAVSVIVVNTALAGAAGAVAAMLMLRMKRIKPDPTIMSNGLLAGLVAIAASCGLVDSWAAVLIGAVAGVLVVVSVFFWEKHRVDDPVGAIRARRRRPVGPSCRGNLRQRAIRGRLQRRRSPLDVGRPGQERRLRRVRGGRCTATPRSWRCKPQAPRSCCCSASQRPTSVSN